MNTLDESNKCQTCGAYGSHAVDCPDMDLAAAKFHIKSYYDSWRKREEESARMHSNYANWVHKQEMKVTFWQGMFHAVKHENNKLRAENRRLKLEGVKQ